jgi:hypothetical protein
MRRMGKRSVQRKQAGSVIARHHHAFCGGEDEVACVDQRVIGTVSENAFLIIEQRQRFREKTAVEGGGPVVTGHSFSCASRMAALDSRSFSRRCPRPFLWDSWCTVSSNIHDLFCYLL